MKKKIIKWSIIAAVVLIAICVIQLLSGRCIMPWQVEKVEFKGFTSCSGPISDTVELSEHEVRKLVQHINCSVYMGPVTAEGCDSDYSFKVYLEDGTKIYFREAGSPRIEVNPQYGEKYWIYNKALSKYAKTLIEKYNLMVAPPA